MTGSYGKYGVYVMYAMYGVYVMYAMYGMYAMHGKHTQCTCVCVTCRHSHSFKITHRTHSCALTYKTRAVICWGERAHGRLDSPPASPSSSSYPPPPTAPTAAEGTGTWAAAGSGFVSVCAGEQAGNSKRRSLQSSTSVFNPVFKNA